MKLCRFEDPKGRVRVGLIPTGAEERLLDLSAAGVDRMQAVWESKVPAEELNRLSRESVPSYEPAQVRSFLAPVERQEIWAAGVTYLRSKTARMEESDFSASAYDRVYDADRPELFFKSLPEKAVPPGEPVGIRRDARWSVPEPELTLVMNSRGEVVGYTIGNDMSSRDIEGENLLYLPQAKVYERSCAVGPFITTGITESQARQWKIRLQIERQGEPVFSGETGVDQIKRSFDSLAEYLFRSQSFPNGAMLLTGTGLVPPDDFTLQAGDRVDIRIDGIGTLINPVIVV